MLSDDFPWYYHPSTVNYNMNTVRADSKTLETSFFTHLFYYDEKINSPYYDMVTPIIQELEDETGRQFFDRLFRIKANLVYKNLGYPPGFYHTPHVDLDVPHEILLYYANDSDGNTLMFKENPNEMFGFREFSIDRRIEPKKGAKVLFDGNIYHAATPPKAADVRVTINFVFRKDD